MLKKAIHFFSAKLTLPLFKNSFWGLTSNVLQNLLFSSVFVIIARQYSTTDFGSYVIANTLYAFVLAFSSLGLGQWFIREILNTEDKNTLIGKFFKLQISTGIIFFLINILLSYILYDDVLIRKLAALIGINVVFDNAIYVIKHINIAQLEQKKTFIIITIEAFIKFLIACLLLLFNFDIVTLSILFIALRFVTLNLFIQMGSSNQISIKHIYQSKLSLKEVKELVSLNWPFIVTGSVFVIYWRIGNVLVSKILTLVDVSHYDISLKIWSLVVILPVIVSSSIYPLLINSQQKGIQNVKNLYKKAFLGYCFFGLIGFTFIYTYSDTIIPFIFGEKYLLTPQYCKEMFLTILLFPTALLQANVLIALKKEKLDMWFNIISLIVNLSICAIGFTMFKTLSVVNYAIFFSFLVFHILQDIVLIIKKVTTIKHTLTFYAGSSICVLSYIMLLEYVNTPFIFILFWLVVLPFYFFLTGDLLQLKAKLNKEVSEVGL